MFLNFLMYLMVKKILLRLKKAKNKMEVTIQSLCGTPEGFFKEYATISGLDDIQPDDENGGKLNWQATIFSGEGCAGSETE